MSILHVGGAGGRGGWGHHMRRYDSSCCVYTGSDVIPAYVCDPPLSPPRCRTLIFPLLMITAPIFKSVLYFVMIIIRVNLETLILK